MSRRTYVLALLFGLMCTATAVQAQVSASMAQFMAAPPTIQNLNAVTGAATPCTGGTAAGYACNGVDLLAFLPLSTFGSGAANDIWGWTDPQTGSEYALIGLNDGTGFVDVSDPVNPVYLGKLPTHTTSSSWRDVKVYQDHAFIVSEASGHGVQVFDLTQLRSVASPPTTFTHTAHYAGVNDVHNIVINEETGFAYTVGNNGGGTTCGGGLHMINIQDPVNPTFAGCFSDPTTGRSGTGYSHDAQCVVYQGPDTVHQGKEICFGSNETDISIADVTDKNNPVALSTGTYPDHGYIHQGWLTEDHRYFYQDDETDGGNTRTVIWDVMDLDDPVLAADYFAANVSKDHNQYIIGDRLYQTNYTVGLRILDISNRLAPVEIAYFDTFTPNDGTSYSGSWSNYPYFASGTIVISSIGEGLFIVAQTNSAPTAAITAPADGTTVTEGDAVSFTGTASDPEDGDLSASIAWTSDLDGALGSGGAVGTSTLSVGAHVITASVTDSQGGSASDQIALTVESASVATDMHVEDIVAGTLGDGRRKNGRAVVTIFDDLGNPVSGATVTGTFSGSIGEAASGTTGGDGTVTFVTNGTTRSKNPVIDFCVDNVTGALTYDSSANADPGFACGGGPGGTTMHVAMLTTGTQGGGKNQRGRATVTILDENSNPVSGATVTGTFSGSFDEQKSGTTDASGQVTLTTSGRTQNPAVNFCVDDVTGALTYDPNANANPGFACSGADSKQGNDPNADIWAVPTAYSLHQNYPNPFNPTTVITYGLPDAGHVTLKVYTMQGREVKVLADGYRTAGRHQATFDASSLSAGIYLYVLQAGAYTETRRMTLLK